MLIIVPVFINKAAIINRGYFTSINSTGYRTRCIQNVANQKTTLSVIQHGKTKLESYFSLKHMNDIFIHMYKCVDLNTQQNAIFRMRSCNGSIDITKK